MEFRGAAMDFAKQSALQVADYVRSAEPDQILFSLVPVSILLFITPFYLSTLLHNVRGAQPDWWLRQQLVVATCITAVATANVAIWYYSTARSSIHLITMSVPAICAGGTLIRVAAQQVTGKRPSLIFSATLSLTTICDITTTKNRFGATGILPIRISSAVAVALKMWLVILDQAPETLASTSPHDRLRQAIQPVKSYFWQSFFVVWLNMFGLREDMFIRDLPDLEQEYDLPGLGQLFQMTWMQVAKDSRFALLITCAKAANRPLKASLASRIVFGVLKLYQSLLMLRLLQAISNASISNTTVSRLLTNTALVYIGLAFSNQLYKQNLHNVSVRVRTMLNSAILSKTFRLPQTHLVQPSPMALLNSDIDAVEAALPFIITLGSNIFEIFVGAYLLYYIVGDAAFLALIPVLAVVALGYIMATRIKSLKLAWNHVVRKRISLTTNYLAQIQSLHMCGLPSTAVNAIYNLAQNESSNWLWTACYRTLAHLFSLLLCQAMQIIVLAGVYYGKNMGKTLTVPETFAVVALVSAMGEPVGNIFVQCAQYLPCLDNFANIQEFLLSEELIHSLIATDAAEAEQADEPRERRQDMDRPLYALAKALRFTDPYIVELVQASLTCAQGERTILDRLNLGLAPGTTTVITGPIGCGKTAILKTLIGERRLDGGRILMGTKSVAYCGHVPWLENTSIRRNIVGGDIYDREWYMEVLDACGLRDDLKSFRQGDCTLAGVDGCNLSGDQKQRTALARALYSCQSVLVLDDVFASLDNAAARRIYGRLFCDEGLITRCGTTVIMATSLAEHMAGADTLITLDNDGGMTLEENRQALRPPSELPSEDDWESDDERPSDGGQLSVGVGSAKALPNATVARETWGHPESDISLYAHFRQFGTARILMGLAALSLAIVLARGKIIYLSIWMSQAPSDRTWLAGYTALAALSAPILTLALTSHLAYITPRSYGALEQRLFATIMGSTPTFLTSKDKGYILSRCQQDATSTSHELSYVFTEVAFVSLLILVEGIIVGCGTLYTVALIPFVAIAVSVVQRFYIEASRKLRTQEAETTVSMYSQFAEISKGVEYIRTFRFQRSFTDRMLTLLGTSQKSQYYIYSLQRFLSLLTDVAGALAAITLVFIALRIRHTASPSSVGLSLLALTLFLDSVNWWVRVWGGLEKSLSAIARLDTALASAALHQHDATEPSADTPDLPPNWPQSGLISLRQVSAKSTVDEETNVLRDINLEIPPGMKLGLVGKTGSGKTSLLLAMLNYLDYDGQILIDGIDISSIPREILRQSITCLPQEALQTLGSVRENLYPHDDEAPTDRVMIDTLTQVELWGSLIPFGGLNAEIPALHLSHGQWQLLSIARAIIHHKHRHSSIVILDDATCHLDPETDRRVQGILADVFKSATVLMVAKRSESTSHMDYMLEVFDGRTTMLVDRGSWAQANGLSSSSETATESTISDGHSILTEGTYATGPSDLSVDETLVAESSSAAGSSLALLSHAKLPSDTSATVVLSDEESEDEFTITPPSMAFNSLQLADRKRELIRKYRHHVINGQTPTSEKVRPSASTSLPEPESLIVQVAGKWESGRFVHDMQPPTPNKLVFDDGPLSPPPSPASWRLDKRDSQARSRRIRTDLSIETGVAQCSASQSASSSTASLIPPPIQGNSMNEALLSPEVPSLEWHGMDYHEASAPPQTPRFEPILSGSGMSLAVRESILNQANDRIKQQLDMLESVGGEFKLEGERALGRSSLRSAIRLQRGAAKTEKRQVTRMTNQLRRQQDNDLLSPDNTHPSRADGSRARSPSLSPVPSFISSPLPSPASYNPLPSVSVYDCDDEDGCFNYGLPSSAEEELIFLQPVAYERPKNDDPPIEMPRAETVTNTTEAPAEVEETPAAEAETTGVEVAEAEATEAPATEFDVVETSTTEVEIAETPAQDAEATESPAGNGVMKEPETEAEVDETDAAVEQFDAFEDTHVDAPWSSDKDDDTTVQAALAPRDALGLSLYDYLDSPDTFYGQSTVVDVADGDDGDVVMTPPTGYEINSEGQLSPISADDMWDGFLDRLPQIASVQERRRRLAALRKSMKIHERVLRRRIAESMHANAQIFIEDMVEPYTPRLPGQLEEEPIPFSSHGYIDTTQVHLQRHVVRAQQQVQRYVMQQAEAQDRRQAEILAEIAATLPPHLEGDEDPPEPEKDVIEEAAGRFFEGEDPGRCVAKPSPEVDADGQEPPPTPFTNHHLRPVSRKKKKKKKSKTTDDAKEGESQQNEESQPVAEASTSAAATPGAELNDTAAMAGESSDQTQETNEQNLTGDVPSVPAEHAETESGATHCTQEENASAAVDLPLSNEEPPLDDESSVDGGAVTLLRYPDFSIEEDSEASGSPEAEASDTQNEMTIHADDGTEA